MVFEAYPVPETTYQKLFVASENRLLIASDDPSGSISYQADSDARQVDDDLEELHFRLRMTERTFLIGAVKAVLYMSCEELDDMDIFLQVRKADADGTLLRSYNVPERDMAAMGIPKEKVPLINPVIYLGPHGQIRASHRNIDSQISKAHYISHSHTEEERVPPGQVVKIETSIWPGGIIFEKDEYLVIKISGHPMYLAEFPTLRGVFKARNKGRHNVHFGGTRGSHFVVPLVKP